MKLVCPACGAVGSFEVFLNEQASRQALDWALGLPSVLRKQLLLYLALFRPPKRSLTWDRVERLLGELQPMIEAGEVRRKGRAWPAPVSAWQAALDQMISRRDSLQLPLKSHGYLLEIVVGVSDKAEAEAERKHEQQLRNQGADRRQPAPTSPADEKAQKDADHQAWVREMQRLGRTDLIEAAEAAREATRATR